MHVHNSPQHRAINTVTTTYIDGLFEQVYDSTTGNLTYRHYILAGGTRVGVETISANSGGTITADTLSFYVRDEVGSVIATVTESLGGANQTVALTSYDAWGKARPTSGASAYQDPAPGTFYSPTPSGQEEGFAGHDNLEDTGLVDMEGRVYDPEVGTFLSADPNVQYPFSSQGYDRYVYVNDNPLSLSDPSGYLSEAQIGGWISDIGPFLNAIPGCQYWCMAVAEAVGGYMQSGNNIGAGLRAGVMAEAEAFAFSYVGDDIPWGTSAGMLFAKAVTEGIIGGAFSEAGGGNFGDGFLGAFTSSELSPVIGKIGGDPNATPPAVYFSAANMATRAVVSAVVGGTVAAMTGGDFTDGAMAAAMQRMLNDEEAKRAIGPISGYPETGKDSWRASDDAAFIKAAASYDAEYGLKSGDALYVTPKLLKAWAMVESGGSESEFLSDPLQVNKAGDWVAEKTVIAGLVEGQQMTPFTSAQAALKWLYYKGTIHNVSGDVIGYRSLSEALFRYNGNMSYFPDPSMPHAQWYANRILSLGGN